MRIMVRTDSSRSLGAGHLMRCLCLADQLALAGHTTVFLTQPAQGDLIVEIQERGHDICLMPPIQDEESDADECLRLIEGMTADWIIVDHYGLGAVWERRMRKCTNALMAIDDIGRSHVADLLLDQNLANPTHDGYRTNPGRLLLGPRYALIRPGFAALRRQSLARRTGALKRVLVSLGGTDPTNSTPKILESLARSGRNDFATDVVIGRGNPHRAEVEAACRKVPDSTLHLHCTTMETLIAAADLAIGAGGTSTWERCVLGCPAVIIVVAENQTALAEATQTAGAAFNLGWHTEALGVKLIDCLRMIDSDTLARMSSCAAEVCDGLGSSRVSHAMGAQ